MHRYRSGYALELRILKLYMDDGWLATRFPKSGRGFYPADILAVKRVGGRTHIHIVECKNATKEDQNKRAIYIEGDQIQGLLKTAKRHGALALVAFSFPHKWARIIEAERLRSSGKMLYVKQVDGALAKKFLKGFI